MEMIESLCDKTLHILFALMMACIYFAVLYFDRIPENPFPSVALLPNAVYFAAALLVLACMLAGMRRKKRKELSTTQFHVGLLCITAFVIILHVCIAHWIPIELGRDFGRVQNMAMNIADGGTFEDNGLYFVTNPNNVSITLLCSWILKVCRSWRAVIFVGMLCVNLSAMLAGLTVRNWTGSSRAGIFACVLTEVLAGLTWRCFIPYTDNYGMIFVSLMLWEYSLPMRKEWKAPLIVLTAMIGSWIKITVLIALLGLMIHALLLQIGKKNETGSGIEVKKSALSLGLCFAIIAAGFMTGKAIERRYAFATDEKHTMGWQYYFMMGQDESGLGTVAGQEYRLIKKEVNEKYDIKRERMDAFLKAGLAFMSRKGVRGNLIFAEKKLNLAYSDGQFHNMQTYEKDVSDESILYKLYFREGQYSFVIAESMQLLWSLVLVMIGFGVVSGIGRENVNNRLLMIILIGVTLYVLLFEVRSKYLYMYLPIYILLAVNAVAGYINKRGKT